MNTCKEKFEGIVMAPIPPPAYGWEPIQDSDTCTLPIDHNGKHRGDRIEWEATKKVAD